VSAAEPHILKARESLALARYALAGDIPKRQGAAPTWRPTMRPWRSSSRVPEDLPRLIAARAASLRASRARQGLSLMMTTAKRHYNGTI
jgi:hypothetical protein